jgi:sulfonate transport system substrate-binding protein
MISMLQNDQADIAITVTDGFVAARATGAPVSLVGTFVESPLIWAASAHPSTTYRSIQELLGKPDIIIGISRRGSGSHTMAYYTVLSSTNSNLALDFASCLNNRIY